MIEVNGKRFSCAAIILAGGTGSRMGREKQYMLLNGKPMLEYTAGVFIKSGLFDEIIIALSPENIKKHRKQWEKLGVKTAPAGPTRTGSLLNSFAEISDAAELIAVHDGARPLVSRGIISDCLAAAAEYGAAVPGIKLKDTVKNISEDGKFFVSTPDRNSLRAVQTPQCYERGTLSEILEAAQRGKDYSDESQVLEKLGKKAAFVQSDYNNIKLTTPEDILIAEALMDKKDRRYRTGFGYDIHRLAEGRPLKIGGITVPHNKGLIGHSDGDVVIHAVCDALLGAAGAGEIGLYFPPTNMAILGINSVEIAEKVSEIIKGKNAEIVNIDVTIVAEEPKMKPYYEAVSKSLAKIFGLQANVVSVKAKSNEGLGEIGAGKAIACYAAVNILL